MYFCALVPNNMKTTQNIYFHSCCFVSPYRVLLRCLCVWYLKSSKALIIHVSRNVFISRQRELCIHFGVILLTYLKNTENIVFFFCIVILFFHKACFASVQAFWYKSSSKTLKKYYFFDNFVFYSHIECFPFLFFRVLVPNTLINTQNLRFWKFLFLSPIDCTLHEFRRFGT